MEINSLLAEKKNTQEGRIRKPWSVSQIEMKREDR